MPNIESYFDKYILQGGITMLALIPLSIVTFGLILQRVAELRKTHVIPEALIAEIRNIESQADFDRFRAKLPALTNPFAQILLAYIEAGERGEPMHPDINPIPIEDAADGLYQSLSQLSTAYVIAPLIGVLGTTIGIMDTFEQFAIAGRRDMSALVAAIDKSLITTMWGLIIAVPAYYFYALLQKKIFRYERYIFPKVFKEVLIICTPYVGSGKPES